MATAVEKLYKHAQARTVTHKNAKSAVSINETKEVYNNSGGLAKYKNVNINKHTKK